MAAHILVNGLGLTSKGTIGVSIATVPDVCKTPSPGGPVPIPYPNFADRSSLKGGTTTVKAKGKMIAVKGSQYSRSNGDEAGTLGGVKSSVNMKATDWITFSFDVKMDGKNACRNTDKKFHNNQNTVDLAGNNEPLKPAGLSQEDDDLWEECHAFKKNEVNAKKKAAAEKDKVEENNLKSKVKDGNANAGQKLRLLALQIMRIELFEELIEVRHEYIDKGCDKFDWFNKGTTEADRRKAHNHAINQAKATIRNIRLSM